jgi:dCTP deaminase
METKTDFPYVNIRPGSFVLAHTAEHVRIPDDLVAVVDGRSSFGRLGIMVHVTAGYIDPGFEGQITLELKNVGPAVVRLYVGDRVCQIRFHRMTGPATKPYSGKYQGNRGAVSSRVNRDFGESV